MIQPLGRADVLGVRFHPAGLSAFTPIPQHQLRGQMIAFDDGELVRAASELLTGVRRPPAAPTLSRPRGLSHKRLQRVERLQKAMSQLGRCDLTQVPLDAGYFDQPHFTREFREFTGQTPSQFLRAPHAFSDFFTHTVRNVKDSGLPNRSH